MPLVRLIWAIRHLCSCRKTGRRDMVGREILTADVLLFISTQDDKCNILSPQPMKEGERNIHLTT